MLITGGIDDKSVKHAESSFQFVTIMGKKHVMLQFHLKVV